MDPNNDTSRKRKLLLAVGIVLFFVIIVLVWYFFYAKPAIAPSLNTPNDPLPSQKYSPGFLFINKLWTTGKASSSTEIIDPLSKPLIQIWNKPATGQTFTSKQIIMTVDATSTVGTTTSLVKKTVRATSTTILFADRTTGYIYGYPVETGEVFQVTNTILPGVHDASFFNNGKRVLMRYFDQDKKEIVGVLANIPSTFEKGSVVSLENIEILPGEVLSVAKNSRNDAISYTVKTSDGVTVYTIEGDSRPKSVASSPFREWVLSYGGKILYATSKPSAYMLGSTVSLPAFQTELAEKTGLMSTVGNEGILLNSMWGTKGLVSFLSRGGDIQLLPVTTLASKCSWGMQAFLVCAVPRSLPLAEEGLPDDWFLGIASFVDDLVTIDVTTGEKYTLYNFTDEDGEFDITHIIMTDKNDVFSFTKKQDQTLWLLNTNLLQGE